MKAAFPLLLLALSSSAPARAAVVFVNQCDGSDYDGVDLRKTQINSAELLGNYADGFATARPSTRGAALAVFEKTQYRFAAILREVSQDSASVAPEVLESRIQARYIQPIEKIRTTIRNLIESGERGTVYLQRLRAFVSFELALYRASYNIASVKAAAAQSLLSVYRHAALPEAFRQALQQTLIYEGILSKNLPLTPTAGL